ncbi:MAG: hypothetical protein ACR2JH_06275 [Solirubrobacteraceae bacterium]
MLKTVRTCIVALVVGAFLAVTASAQTGDVLHPPGQPAFVPRLGDWEATTKGFRASFELVRNRRNLMYGAAGYGIYDLVLSEPATCPTDPTAVALSSAGSQRFQLLVGRTGAFPYRQGRRIGALTGTRSAVVTAAVGTFGQGTTCRTHLRWRLRPMHRLPVSDGPWTISFSDGEHSRTTVSGGGRATSLGLPSVSASCAGAPGPIALGGVDIFIPPNRRVDETLPESGGATLRLLWTFTSRTAGSGSVTADAPGCQSRTLSFVARQT